MNQYLYKELIIEVYDETTYTLGSADNKFNYSKHYFGEAGQGSPVSKHAVKIFREDQELNNCIVIGSGGSTGVYPNSSLLSDDLLLICCCDTVFCLTLPGLELKWKARADQATCFQLFKLEDDYLVHGELQITRLGSDGKIKWQFSGADIFVSMEGEEEVKLEKDHILLTDFENTKYKLDFDGKLIWDTYKRA